MKIGQLNAEEFLRGNRKEEFYRFRNKKRIMSASLLYTFSREISILTIFSFYREMVHVKAAQIWN